MLPIRDHLSMLSQQFLARALQPDHPSHPVATAHPGPRGCRATLRSAFFTPSFYRSYTDTGTSSGVVPSASYKTVIKQIHTDTVRRSMAALPPNRVLNAKPPPSLCRGAVPPPPAPLHALKTESRTVPSIEQLPGCDWPFPHRPLPVLRHGGPHYLPPLLLSLPSYEPDHPGSVGAPRCSRRLRSAAPMLQPSAAGAPSS